MAFPYYWFFLYLTENVCLLFCLLKCTDHIISHHISLLYLVSPMSLFYSLQRLGFEHLLLEVEDVSG